MMGNGASLASGPDGRKRRVSYFYEAEIGDARYGVGHIWEPKRIKMVHDLIRNYHLDRYMEISPPNLAGVSDFLKFHTPEYIDYLASIKPEYVDFLKDTSGKITDPSLKRFNLKVDWECPIFHGLFEYCRAYTGGSISAAAKLNRHDADIAINWSGGMHRAKRDKASGFGYVNDIVLGILELLKTFKRVLYIDIGFHHGDAVEEAFYTTDRVMTISFHKLGKYIPRSGRISDLGVEKGMYYSLNAPLKDGLCDESFRSLFRPVIEKAMEVYQPEVIVLQSCADSLSRELVGTFNLSLRGHGDCLRYIRTFNVPLMLLGGGFSKIPNAVRCWCYETAVAVGIELRNKLPPNKCLTYFKQGSKLQIRTSSQNDFNTRRYIGKIKTRLLGQLSQVIHAPSVQFHDTPSISQATEMGEIDMEKRQNPRILSGNASYESDSDEDWCFLG